VLEKMMKMRNGLCLLAAILLCGAAPDKRHPLPLVVPAPASALRLAYYNDTPDETVLEKVRQLETVTRAANTNAADWTIFLSPAAAILPVKGWKADMNRPDTPLPEATLGECLQWLCRHVPELRFEVLDGRVLIQTKKQKQGRTVLVLSANVSLHIGLQLLNFEPPATRMVEAIP
jgi:hypothetical protein